MNPRPLCAAVTEDLNLDNENKHSLLTLSEAQRCKIKVLAAGDDLLALSPQDGRANSERERTKGIHSSYRNHTYSAELTPAR